MPLTEYDPSLSDLAPMFAALSAMMVYLTMATDYIRSHSETLVVAGLICTIIVLMDWLSSSKRRLRQAMEQNEFFVDVLRRVHPLTNGENNMSKDIGRVVGGKLFSYPEIKRISARLMKSAMDCMVREKKLSPEDRDVLAEMLAIQTNAWELYPKKKVVIPDSQVLKDQIKSRILRVTPDPVPIPGASDQPPVAPKGFDRLLRRKTA